MKRSLITGLAVVLAAGTLVFAETAPVSTSVAPKAPASTIPSAGKVPRIQFDSLIYDCGKTSLVQSVSGKFVFKNVGEATLELKRPQPGCGCTVAEVKPVSMKLEPGEEGEISFKLAVGGHQGVMQKHINVPSNDPANPNVGLTIKVELEKIFETIPSQITFSEIEFGSKTNFSFLVKRIDGNPLKVTRVDTSTPAIAASFEMITNAVSSTAKVTVVPKGDGNNRQLFGTVSVFVENMPAPAVTVPVFGRIVGEVRVIPEAVFWGIADPKKWPGAFPDLMMTRRIRIVPGKPYSDFTVKNLATDIKGTTISMEAIEGKQSYGNPGETGKVYEIVAKLPVAPEESVRGNITFQTNLPNTPLVTIPVSINVLKR